MTPEPEGPGGTQGSGEDTKQEEDAEGEEARFMSALMKQAGPFMGAAYTLTGGLLGLGLIGYFLDLYLDTSPAFLLSGLGIGLIVGFWELAKVAFRKDGDR